MLQGTHSLTGQIVALKFLQTRSMGTTNDAEQVNTEIQALTTLRHSHIINLIDVLNDDKHIVLVFDFAGGGNLLDLLRQSPGGRLSEDVARETFRQIIGGMAFAHDNKICHRDLKLENILLDSEKNVKIADFGLSAFFKPGNDFLTKCGTISYIAPEVLRGEHGEGTALDVWGAGVILAALLSGRHPFENLDLFNRTDCPSKAEVRRRILHGEYVLSDDVSEGARDLISRMLCLDPKKRVTMYELFSLPWLLGGRTASMSGFDLDIDIPKTGEDSSTTPSSPKVLELPGGVKKSIPKRKISLKGSLTIRADSQEYKNSKEAKSPISPIAVSKNAKQRRSSAPSLDIDDAWKVGQAPVKGVQSPVGGRLESSPEIKNSLRKMKMAVTVDIPEPKFDFERDFSHSPPHSPSASPLHALVPSIMGDRTYGGGDKYLVDDEHKKSDTTGKRRSPGRKETY